ncbi:MAG: gluconate 2-dehydrogenase subunit 3 family protein [Clostridia bacterium]|nr:gluconate 2-dehydrogenase subunit 3 family protein [Clostridia bacterium]
MTDLRFHYPDYDVMASIDEWDDHTKEIVLKRLGPFPEKRFLEEQEVRKLRLIIKHLVYDNRDEILDWILSYIDQRLHSEIGENQRKLKAPPEKLLIREGLKTLDKLAEKLYYQSFADAGTKEQFEMLASIQLGKAANIPEWATIPQKDLFDKLLDMIISAYYSHPTIWSEMGYGGPAYPRGYYRIELPWTDPWEAKLPEEKGQE